jgi:hypothetical protein
MGNTASAAAARESANDQSTDQDHNQTIPNFFNPPPGFLQNREAHRIAHQRRERELLVSSEDSGNDTATLPIHDSNNLLARYRLPISEPAMPPLPSQGAFYMTGVAPVLDPASSLPADAICSICWEPLTNDVVEMETCNHHYHTACILEWFETDAPRDGDKPGTCPNCRREFYDPDQPAADEFETLFGGRDEAGGALGASHSDDDETEAPRTLLESIRRSFEVRERAREEIARTGGESERPPLRFGSTRSRFDILGADRVLGSYEDDAREFARMERELALAAEWRARDLATMGLPAIDWSSAPLNDGEPRPLILRAEGERVEPMNNQTAPEPDRWDIQDLVTRINRSTRRPDTFQGRTSIFHNVAGPAGYDTNPPGPRYISPSALRRDFESYMARYGVTAEEVIGNWRQEFPLTNDLATVAPPRWNTVGDDNRSVPALHLPVRSATANSGAVIPQGRLNPQATSLRPRILGESRPLPSVSPRNSSPTILRRFVRDSFNIH